MLKSAAKQKADSQRQRHLNDAEPDKNKDAQHEGDEELPAQVAAYRPVRFVDEVAIKRTPAHRHHTPKGGCKAGKVVQKVSARQQDQKDLQRGRDEGGRAREQQTRAFAHQVF